MTAINYALAVKFEHCSPEQGSTEYNDILMALGNKGSFCIHTDLPREINELGRANKAMKAYPRHSCITKWCMKTASKTTNTIIKKILDFIGTIFLSHHARIDNERILSNCEKIVEKGRQLDVVKAHVEAYNASFEKLTEEAISELVDETAQEKAVRLLYNDHFFPEDDDDNGQVTPPISQNLQYPRELALV